MLHKWYLYLKKLWVFGERNAFKDQKATFKWNFQVFNLNKIPIKSDEAAAAAAAAAKLVHNVTAQSDTAPKVFYSENKVISCYYRLI